MAAPVRFLRPCVLVCGIACFEKVLILFDGMAKGVLCTCLARFMLLGCSFAIEVVVMLPWICDFVDVAVSVLVVAQVNIFSTCIIRCNSYGLWRCSITIVHE